ncbi:SusC/RagA family TonB-linked outer membrane protein [Saccharicrinis aurantiacus]|uniref:SusC/RagA family TonB-linked outer membrane protein n=1 Tax=Saccharicrinis aurantiacus TaxID=1849719 RepID=UPI00249075A1|nr:TonB-dependent receptor [Saccharicrinis aurantiacus]
MRYLLNNLFILLMIGGSVFAQNNTVVGSVIDKSDGQPMIGVSVVIKGTVMGTVTDINGSYSLQAPDNNQTIVYSFIGYEAQEVVYKGQNKIDITLSTDSESIDEVVVTGYGNKRKETYTGASANVDGKALADVPVASFDQALQGQSPGLVAVASSGAPGAAATIRIRGVSSVNAGSDPLFIMDGIPISASQFSALNQNDIQNISVLKDATATALYGSRASNGVIVITTKRGDSSGETKIGYRAQYGYNQIARDNFNMMNTQQKIAYEEELGLKNYTPEEKLALSRIDTNWLDEVLRNAFTKSHEITAQGGNEKTRFYLSGSYYAQEGILYSSDFDRINFRANIDNKVSDKVNLGVNLTLGYQTHSNTVTGGEASNNVYNPIFGARLLNPYFAPKDANGNYNSEGFPFANPVEQLLLNSNDNNTLKIVGGIFFDAELAPNLVWKTNVGLDFYDYTGNDYLHPESVWGAEFNGRVSRSFQRNARITPTNTLRYKFDINDVHKFGVLGGQEIVSNHYDGFGVSGMNLPNENLRVLGVASSISPNGWSGSNYDYTVASFFANMDYTYNYKYMVDLSIRRDGSSRFGKNSRWGTFWSAGAGWNMQEEAFLQDIHWIDQMKLRASIGETGNYNIGNYDHLNLFSYGTYDDYSAAMLAQFGNDDLTWEKKLKANIGLEMSMFRRLQVNVDLYHETTKDMLFYVPRSLTTGTSGRFENVGEMVNKGIEVDVNYDLVQTNNLRWNVSANVAYNINTITELYGGITEIDGGFTTLKVGQPYGTFNLTEWAGVDASNGKGLWYTADGGVTNMYSDSDRQLMEGKSWMPPVSGGFATSLSYKGWNLNAQFTWMADKWIINSTRYFTESQGVFMSYNQSTEMLDYWKQPGDDAKHPHPKYQDNQYDTRLLENASFLRLKNLTVSYNLNDNLLDKTKVFRSARVYLQGQNLLTWTGYNGMDPEFYGASEANMYPNVRTFSIGLDLGF